MTRALALGVLTVFVVTVGLAALAGIVVADRWSSEADVAVAKLVQGAGLGLVQARLQDAPPEQWPVILDEVRPHVAYDLRVAPADTPPSPSMPVLPIEGTDRVLVVGPIAAPPPGPVLRPLFAFVATLVLLSTGLITLPLARELRRTEAAIRGLGEGRWEQVDLQRAGPLRRLAAHVNQSAQQLAAMFREREELLQAVTHELGTPLSRIRLHLDLLEPAVPPDHRPRLEQIARDLDELDELCAELVSWVEAGTATPERQAVDVLDTLDTLLELACQDAEHLDPQRQGDGPLVVQASPRLFQRAVANLLRNAVHYARAVVVVAAEQDGEHVVIEVRDDGPGIPEAHRSRLFDPFTRVAGSRSRDHGGLGLGLAIVHRIVTAHGGTVAIVDAPEGGACVRVRWPLR